MHLETLCLNGFSFPFLLFIDFHALESIAFGSDSIQKAHITISSPYSRSFRCRLSETDQSPNGKRMRTDRFPFCAQT